MRKLISLSFLLLLSFVIVQMNYFNEDEIQNGKDIYLKNRSSIYIVEEEGDFSTIAEAIAASESGDTIEIKPGIYYGNIVINKTINLVGSGADKTTINGSSLGNVLTINVDGCNISGLLITGSGKRWNSGMVINSNNNTIRDCVCEENMYGLSINGENNIIQDCESSLNKYSGFKIHESDNNTIIRCLSIQNQRGIVIGMGANNNNISFCRCVKNSINGISNEGSKNIIVNNIFEENFGYGVINNPQCKNNIIYKNVFISNNKDKDTQALDEGMNNKWDNGKEGNYWSDWTFPDNDDNEIVDNPYNVVGSTDNYPLIYHPIYDKDKDGVMDDKDYYPNDPNRWKEPKDEEMPYWIYGLLIIIIFVSLLIVFAILIIRRKRKSST